MDLVKSVLRYIIVATYAIVLYLALSNLSQFSGVASYVLSVSYPIVLGFFIAYVLNLPMKWLEQKAVRPLFARFHGEKKEGAIRSVSILATFVVVSAVLACILRFVVPQILVSARGLVESMYVFINQVTVWIPKLLEDWDLSAQVVNSINQYWREILTAITESISNGVPKVIEMISSITSHVTTMVLAIILSIYMLASKERIANVLRSIMNAYLPRRQRQWILEVTYITNSCFEKYITGQVIEAFIIGGLCFVGMSLFRFPYALIISVFVGATGLIPMFGAFIGAAIGAFLICITSPIQALWFIVFIICLQQFEGNVIYPRVVGTSLGLRGIYVMLAIIIGGNLFGFAGMVLGIPLFATFYTLVRRNVMRRNLIRRQKEQEAERDKFWES
ncbi:MAG: AI-2E family transporter [Eubacteriales bacterium]